MLPLTYFSSSPSFLLNSSILIACSLIKLLYDKSEYYKKEYDNAKNKQQDIINNSHEYEEYEKINIENKLKIYHKKYDIDKNLADELYNEIFNELVMDDLYKIILKREY